MERSAKQQRTGDTREQRAWSSERTVEQLAVVDGHACDAPDEVEVLQVLRVRDARVRVDLQGVVVAAQATVCTSQRMNATSNQ